MKYLLFLCGIFYFQISFAQTQLEMNESAVKKYKSADSQLNKLYNQLMKLEVGESKQYLIQAEKDWIKYRDSHCKYDSVQYDGGSIQSLIMYDCLLELTNERIKHIKESIEDKNR